MSIHEQLRAREDVDDDDIPEIIGRAETLQVESRQAADGRVAIGEVKEIALELDIAAAFVEQAISELRAERARPVVPEPVVASEPVSDRPGRANSWPMAIVAIAAIGAVLAAVFLRDGATVVVIEKPAPAERVLEARSTNGGEGAVELARSDAVTEPVATGSVGSVVGDWVLEAYHMSQDGVFFEVPLSKEGIYQDVGDKVRERWHFGKDGRFRHVMSRELGFSGRYSIEIAPVVDWQGLPGGERFLLRAVDVKSTVPGIERAEEFFLGVSGEELSLFYLGQTKEVSTAPSQGHVFRRD